MAQLETGITHTKTQLTTEEEILQSLRTQVENLRQAVDENRKHYDEKKQILEARRTEYSSRQRSQYDAEKKIAIAETTISNLSRSLQQTEQEGTGRAAKLEAIAAERTQTETTLTEKQQELETHLHRQQELKAQVLQSQETLENLRATLATETRTLDARRNEHALLKSLVESLEGYPDSIKFLKKNARWQYGAPLLSDIFVVQPAYRAALELVLDSYLNHYVADTIPQAAEAVALLQEAKKGKASFFILDKIPELHSTRESHIPGTLPALSVVSVEPKYEKLAQMLLAHVSIATENGVAISADTSPGSTIVQQDGSLRHSSHSLTGGSVGVFEGNKIGRAKNLERLQEEIGNLNQKVAAVKSEIATAQTALSGYNNALADRSIERTQQDLNRLRNAIINLDHKRENFQQLDEQDARRRQDLTQQLQHTESGIRESRESLQQVLTDLDALQQQGETAREEFARAEEAYNTGSAHYNQQNLSYTKQQNKLETLRQDLQYRNRQQEDLHKQISQNKAQQEHTVLQLTETQGKLHGGDAELYEMLAKKEKDERSLNERDRAYIEFRNAVTTAENTLSQHRRQKEQTAQLLQTLKDKLNEMKLRLAGLKERLMAEFRVNLDSILDEDRSTELSLDELNTEAERLKKRLDAMGDINPTAIEAYTEMKGRHDFIAEQKTDLENARNSLLATIEEVENTANQKFQETFEAVRQNFTQVFKALFTEQDAADLRLTDPANLAESNIEIYAQPKGKRPSTLTQLSGGEKTLTSTAFLFAIYLIKPAPFCILDEVDAPLDDANVGKFTGMIRQFADNSQFIIVTHNKQTMSAVDVIYGVTMQEAGVSKLVPVDFRSLE